MRLINSKEFWYNVLHGGNMNNIHVISIQHGYLLKKPIIQTELFVTLTTFKDFLQTQGIEDIVVDLQRFNISDVLFRFIWGEYSLNISTQRVDLFFTSSYAPDNVKRYNQIIGEIRSLMSALFSYLNQHYGVNRLGVVGNYMLIDKDVPPVQQINNQFLDKQLIAKKFTVHSIEGQDSILWQNRNVNDIKRIWNAKYNSPNRMPVTNLGIMRDINVQFFEQVISDEDYNKFIDFAETLLSIDAIKAMLG